MENSPAVLVPQDLRRQRSSRPSGLDQKGDRIAPVKAM